MYSAFASEDDISEHPQVIRATHSINSDSQFLLLFFILILVALFTRRTDALLHAQFWAEDGKYFYAAAYEYGWRSLLFTQLGYFLTLQRLVAMLSLVVPLSFAPLIMNLVAIAIQALPPTFLLARRFAFVGTIPVRLFMSLLLLTISIAPELHANITNAHWHLALLAFLVLVAQPPETTAWRLFDCLVLLFSGLSGPFCIFLAPILVILVLVRHNRWTRVLLAINCVAAAIQVPAIFLTSVRARLHDPLGASFTLLARITGTQVVLGSLLGPKFILRHPAASHTAAVVGAAAAVAVIIYIMKRGSLELRLLTAFGACVAAAGLWSPMVTTGPQWPVMVLPYAGARYWFILVLAWLWTLLWLVGKTRSTAIRVLAALALAAALRTGISHWKYQPFADLDFQKFARDFQQLPSGESIQIPINPPGRYMVLRKH